MTEPWREIPVADDGTPLAADGVVPREVDGITVYSHAPLVPIDSLHPHPENPREGDVGAISESIRHNGFYGECIAQASTRAIAIGNHRWLAARALGMSQVPALLPDIDDDTALRWMLADNRASDLASYNEAQLADTLTRLQQDSDRALTGTLFSASDLDDLLALLNGVPWEGKSEPHEQVVGKVQDALRRERLSVDLDKPLFARFRAIVAPGDAERIALAVEAYEAQGSKAPE